MDLYIPPQSNAIRPLFSNNFFFDLGKYTKPFSWHTEIVQEF